MSDELQERPFECPECGTDLIPYGRYQYCEECRQQYKKKPVKFNLVKL